LDPFFGLTLVGVGVVVVAVEGVLSRPHADKKIETIKPDYAIESRDMETP
jgi:hypothetical protein